MNTLLCCGRLRTLLQKMEQLAETKKNGPSDVLSRKNDIQHNWKSFSELREETDLFSASGTMHPK